MNSASSLGGLRSLARQGQGGRADCGSLLCVANYPSDAGYAWWLMENFWVQLGQLAQQRGGRAFVAFPEVCGISPVLGNGDLSVVELPVPATMDHRQLRTMHRFIRDNSVRTIYFTDRAYWSSVYALFHYWGVKSIIVHDHVPGERPAPPRWKLLAKQGRHALLPRGSADLYVGVSRFVVDRFSAVAGVPAGRCQLVLNGVPRSHVHKPVHREFGIPSNAQVVVSSGRAVRYKGIDFIIRCAEQVTRQRKRSDVFFLHLGNGPELGDFRLMVRNMGLEERFIFGGRRSDVAALLSSCSVAIHASRGEAFSLAILEFMAAGLAAIVPDHCGNAEAVEHMESGILYEPGDLDAASGWILRLLDDQPLRERIGRRAARRAESKFSLEAMNKHFRSVVDEHVVL